MLRLEAFDFGSLHQHGRSYYLDAIERCVIGGLKEKLGGRDAIAYYVRVFNEERHRASANAIANYSRLEARLAEAQRELDRMIDALIKGRINEAEADERLPTLQAARDRLKAELELAEGRRRSSACIPRL